MNKDLQLTSSSNLATSVAPATFTQTGDKNTQIAHANSVHQVINIFVPGMAHQPGNAMNTCVSLNLDCYNLFVIGEEDFQGGHFIIPKDRALTESMSSDAKKQFSALSADAITQIRTFPSLFASENHQYGRTDDSHIAYFGLVTDVKIQDNGIKVYFHKLSAIPQQKLNELTFELALGKAASFNELNRTHWAIKRVNLIEELRKAGISVLAPT
jgi:hypothetical protein